MKRGAEVQAQVFIYILTAFIIALTMLFGFRAIRQTGKMASDAELIKFKNDIVNDIKSLDYGQTREYTVRVPKGYEVCFVSDIYQPSANINAFLQNAYEASGKNLFLINKKTNAVTPLDTPPLEIEDGIICLDAQHKVILENKGKTINVKA